MASDVDGPDWVEAARVSKLCSFGHGHCSSLEFLLDDRADQMLESLHTSLQLTMYSVST